MANPGILFVTMQPKDANYPIHKFHDWYNNEHGPNRLRLPFFKNGFRYKAVDDLTPEWMAIYDLDDMEKLKSETYTRLRAPPVQSQRERDVMKKLSIDRRFYDVSSEEKVEGFKQLECIENADEQNVLVTARVTLQDDSKRQLYEEWFDKEHVPMLSKVPGWRRSRRFVTSTLEQDRGLEILGIHEYDTENGLNGEEFQAAINTPWRNQIFQDVVKSKSRRLYHLYYIFGAASRDLLSPQQPTMFPDGKTKVLMENGGVPKAIESYITTSDAVVIPYRLEGNTDPDAPTIILINSILVGWEVWDSFVSQFLKEETNRQYRILRFNARGRYAQSGDQPATLDVLVEDVVSLLDTLKIQQAASVIGVSLGGATALRLALKYPKRISAFVACDTNAKAPPSNPKAWGDRIQVAEKEAALSDDGEPIVGENLAEMTVRRWFTEGSYAEPVKKADIEKIKEMVKTNSLAGFRTGVNALYQYNFEAEMSRGTVTGLFLAGSADGVLPDTMKKMAESYGDGSSEFKLIQDAGHLPMVEQPHDFTRVISYFLAAEALIN
jgi:pimeloyl-ACP methyl ester carboxylesterase